MTTIDPDLDGLLRALERTIDDLDDGDWQRPTPCTEWDVAALVDHLTTDLHRFAAGMRGEEVDWSADAGGAEDRAAAFGEAAAQLRAACDEGHEAQVDWQLAELAAHAWDLRTATGATTEDLDESAAVRGLDFVRRNLSDDRRGDAFSPAVEPRAEADAYERLAAFSGRGAAAAQ